MMRGLLIGVLVLMLAACGGGKPQGAAPAAGGIVSLSPAMSETLFALGVGERVVGVTRFCNRPQAIQDGVKAGRILAVGDLFNPGVENIVHLRPALVLAERTTHISKLDRLREMHIHFVDMPLQTMEDIRHMILGVGALVGAEGRAKVLVADIDAALEPPLAGRLPRVLLVYHSNDVASVSAVGPRSYQSEIIVTLGATSVLQHIPVVTPTIGPEQILALDPDLVLELDPEGRDVALHERWALLPSLRALRTGDLRSVTGTDVDAMGPMVVGLIRKLRGELIAWQQRHGES